MRRRKDEQPPDQQRPVAAHAYVAQGGDPGDGGDEHQVAQRIDGQRHGGRGVCRESRGQERVEHDCQHCRRAEPSHRGVPPHPRRHLPRLALHGHNQRGCQERVEQRGPDVCERGERRSPGSGLQPDVVGPSGGPRGHGCGGEQDLRAPESDPIDGRPTQRHGHPHGRDPQRGGHDRAHVDVEQSQARRTDEAEDCNARHPHKSCTEPHAPVHRDLSPPEGGNGSLRSVGRAGRRECADESLSIVTKAGNQCHGTVATDRAAMTEGGLTRG